MNKIENQLNQLKELIEEKKVCKVDDCKCKKKFKCIGGVVLAIAAVVGIGFAVYKLLAPKYDDFEDDFDDDDFFENDDEDDIFEEEPSDK
ncbi:hypothetical protein P261_01685 [Lachnospiraceae bacterium TWA4]|nr:hypothetical protein P261_01685 [Lachnospiraceae bacterium TWA4]